MDNPRFWRRAYIISAIALAVLTFVSLHRNTLLSAVFESQAEAATIAYVQSAAVPDNSGTSVSKGFSSNTTAGNAILVAVSWGTNDAVTSCTDTQGNIYSIATTAYDSGNNQSLAICYALNTKGGADAVTVRFSGSPFFHRLIITEYSGIASANALDVTAKNIANGITGTNKITSTATTTRQSGELIFGAVMDDTGTSAISAGTGFIQRNSVNNKDLTIEDMVQPTAGSVAATFTFSKAHRYLAQMATFKSAVANPTPTPTSTSTPTATPSPTPTPTPSPSPTSTPTPSPTITPTPTPTPTPSPLLFLVAGYVFSEGSGTTSQDSSGNANTITFQGASWTTGKNGNGLSFNGSSSYADASNSASLDIIGSAITIEAWVNPTVLIGDTHLVSKIVQAGSHNSPYFSYSLHVINGNIPRFWITTGGAGAAVESSTVLSPNSWFHITGTYDGTMMRIYVNGIQAGSAAHTGALTGYAGPLRLGSNGSGGETWNGAIDDIRVYSRALSQAEIQTDMNTPVGGTPNPTPSPSPSASPGPSTTPSPNPVPGSTNLPFTKVVIESNQAPWGKNVGDFNGDGQLDIVEAGGDLGGNVYWYQYPSWTKFQIGSVGGDDDLQIGDMNNDGAPDVVVNGGTYWYENPRGKGGNVQGLWTLHTIDASNNGHDLVLGDVNADGKLDVLTRGEFGSTALYLQGATPDAWTAVPMSNAPNGEGSALADINRDGRTDIIGNGYWLEQPASGITNGAAWIRHDFVSWSAGSSVNVADINNDGRIDILIAASEAGAGTLSWFENPVDSVNGVWIRHDIDAVTDVHRFHLVDMNKDGNPDIVFAEMDQSSTKRVGIYYNSGGGSSWTLQTLATTGSHNIAVGDIGNDGDVDIVGANWNTASPDGGSLNLWRNDWNPNAPYKVLIFSKTLGFRHGSIATGIAAIQSLGAANNFTADATEDSNMFTDANLAQYKDVIFLNPSGNILDAAQQAALQRFVESGRGFVGIHNASALLDPAMDAWTWYNDMIGAKYQSEIGTQPLCLQISITSHPSTIGLPDPWCFTEEAYNFDQNPKLKGVTALVNLDESAVSGGTMGADHPFSWYKSYDGGRMWYTNGGANDAEYSQTNFLNHILGGIKYAAGVAG